MDTAHTTAAAHTPRRVPAAFVALMATLMSVAAISIDAMLPALAHIGRDLNSTYVNQPQLILSAVFGGMAIGQLVAGPLSDAFGRKPLLLGCLALYMVGAVVCLLSHSMGVMLLGRVIQGLGAAGPVVSVVSIVRDKFQGREMAKVLSLVMMIFIMAPVLAPALGQGLMWLAQWRVIFAFFVLYALCVGAWVWLALDETLPPSQRVPWRVATIWHGAKHVVGHPQTLRYAVAMGLVFGSFIGYLTSTQQIFQVQYQVGSIFVVYFGLQALGFGVSSLLNSRWVETLGMRYLVMRGLVALVAIGVGMATLSAFMTVPFAVFFGFGLVALFCIGLLFGNLNALAMEPMGHIAGTAAAIIAAIANVISLTVGTVVGQLYNGTLVPVALGFASLGGTALWLVWRAEQHKPPQA
ncbi:MAG: multidrug effflux MFS transporter [Burkholderiaceae bacterium]|nr:multidrug effflux MFS transporter [Burkholderiaceae bacterium]